MTIVMGISATALLTSRVLRLIGRIQKRQTLVQHAPRKAA